MRPVSVTFIHHPDSDLAKGIVGRASDHFFNLGMGRSGVHMRIPVRFRSEPLDPAGDRFTPIRGGSFKRHIVIALMSSHMSAELDRWEALLHQTIANIDASSSELLLLPVELEEDAPSFADLSPLQSIRWHSWGGLKPSAQINRLLIHIVNEMRRMIMGLGTAEREQIFVSHAKADGKQVAERVVAHVRDTANDLKLETFYDAKELEFGGDWREGLRTGAAKGSLLALVTDKYDSRLWCNQEVLWSKKYRRPMLLVDVGRKKIGRKFPYAGNVPLVSEDLETEAGIEMVLLELLSEALRCDIFMEEVADLADESHFALPRPPELHDLACHRDRACPTCFVYPDPPLSDLELELLSGLMGESSLKTLSEAR